MLGTRTGIFKSVREIEHSYDLEVILVQLAMVSNGELLICSCYRPPNAGKIWMETFESFLNDVCSRHSKIASQATSTYHARAGSRTKTPQAQTKEHLLEYWTTISWIN